MQRLLIFSIIIQLLFTVGCTITQKTRHQNTQREVSVEPKVVEPVEEQKVQGQAQYTFLDTINEGNELVLNESDFGKNSQQSGIGVADGAAASTVGTEPRYRVQVFASNRIEAVREQKKELEKKLSEQGVIGYEAPYYKLYTGSFSKRQDAQTILLKLKKLGFMDAWIVSTNVIPEN